MIITQRYNSVKDIDKEFIPSLEELLSNSIPNFQFIKNHEENTSDDINFSYYLFFGNQTNAPIGFAQLELKNEKPIKKNILKSLFKGKSKEEDYEFEKSLRWTIPGSLKEGFIFKPQYIKHASETARDLVKGYSQREDIISQEIYCSQAYEVVTPNEPSSKELFRTTKKTTPDTLIKNRESYQEFFNSLPVEIKKEIKLGWKTVQQDLQYFMGEYESFKTCFEYKSSGASQYKELKKNTLMQKYLQEGTEINYMTLETSQEIKALIILATGNNGNIFYDIILKDESVPNAIPHQMAILKFYDNQMANRLHFAGEIPETKELTDLGYTLREQLIMTMERAKP